MPNTPATAVPSRAWLVAAAAGALALGVVVYVVDRRAGSAQLLPAAWHAARPLGAFGALGSVIPDFAHAFALSMLTGLLAHTRRGAAAACVAWWLIDSALEAAQARLAAEALSPHLPAFVSAYLLGGTFDVADLAAIAVGAGLAYTLLARRWPNGRTGRTADRATPAGATRPSLRAPGHPPADGATTPRPASSRARTPRPSS